MGGFTILPFRGRSVRNGPFPHPHKERKIIGPDWTGSRCQGSKMEMTGNAGRRIATNVIYSIASSTRVCYTCESLRISLLDEH